jgi:hypothetical protein
MVGGFASAGAAGVGDEMGAAGAGLLASAGATAGTGSGWETGTPAVANAEPWAGAVGRVGPGAWPAAVPAATTAIRAATTAFR